MLIICTRDQRVVRQNYQNKDWGTVNIISDDYTQKGANSAFYTYLSQLKPQESLCILAHGNDYSIGDVGYSASGWDWSAADIASYFHLANAATGWMDWPTQNSINTQVLFQTCSDSEDNFASGCAYELFSQANTDYGVDCYGYTIAVPVTSAIPAPSQLAANQSLTKTTSIRTF